MTHHTTCATVADARAEAMFRFLVEEPVPGHEETFPDRDHLAAIREILDDWSSADVDDAINALIADGRVEAVAGPHGIVWITAFAPPRLAAVPA